MHAVVVGGGIVGLASAYSLRRRGVEVTVLEQGRIGHGSTPRAGGAIREQFSTDVSVALSRESVAVWRDFADRFDVDIDYRRNGYLFLARTEATAAAVRDVVAFLEDRGVPSRYVEGDDLGDHFPGLRTGQFTGGAYSPDDGYADTERALQGYALAAAREGAAIHLGRRVTDVLRQDGHVIGVETDDGTLEADVVVNAAGAWAARVGALAGVDLPIRPERRQLAVVEPDRAVIAESPFVADLDSGAFVRPADEDAYVGGHFEKPGSVEADPDAYDRGYDVSWAETALSRARELSTAFGPDSSITGGWAGLYAMTPDHHPIVEEVLPGFVVAAGFSGHGFMQAPATDQVVAELVADGAASTVDISRLTLDRFERGETLSETLYSA